MFDSIFLAREAEEYSQYDAYNTHVTPLLHLVTSLFLGPGQSANADS